MEDPANKPTPVEAYSCALSLSLERPVTDKPSQTKATNVFISALTELILETNASTEVAYINVSSNDVIMFGYFYEKSDFCRVMY